MVGRTVSHYRILAKLGRGGMGVVYEAEDLKLGRRVALKFLSELIAQDEIARRRFEREARLASALNHPNICTIHEIDEADGQTFIVMELVKGGTLAERIQGRPLPLDEMLSLAIDVCDALVAAHACGVVHRDLKPSNIFVSSERHAKVADFGLAKLASLPEGPTLSRQPPLTLAGGPVGTLAYMSPEQARGEPLDGRSDLFSFGAVLYEMATGQRAFAGETQALLFDGVLNRAPRSARSLNPQLPPEMESVLSKLLEKDREQRYQDGAELRDDLRRVQRSAFGPGGGEPERRRSRRARIAIAGAAALVVALSATALLLLRQRQRPPVASGYSEYVQLTDFNDAAIAPALSPDGRILAFLRPGAFGGATADGQIYAEFLPNGQPVQLTRDTRRKQSPTFSPDGTRVLYTALGRGFTWDTWQVPLLGGLPRLFLANASGLTWIGERQLLYSEIKQGTHMGIVTSNEDRAQLRDVYLPAGGQGAMAHRSALSPDREWVLVVEMDGTGWLPCRLVPFDGSSAGRRVGPLDGQCTTVAWSHDGKWMYFSSNSGGKFHLWRQRFPDGSPEQITFGPFEQEGTVVTPDDRHLITSMGADQASVWLHDEHGDRQILSEGFALLPTMTASGNGVYFLLRTGTTRGYVSGELWYLDLATGHKARALPGYLMSGYSLSPDDKRVVFTSVGNRAGDGIWIADLDRRTPPRQLTHGGEFRAMFGAHGEIFYMSAGKTRRLYRMSADGSGAEMVVPDAITFLIAISPDERWAAVALPGGEGNVVSLLSTRGEKPVMVCDTCVAGFGPRRVGPPLVNWSGDGKYMYIALQVFGGHVRKTLLLPYRPGHPFQQSWVASVRASKPALLPPGSRVVDVPDVFSGVRLSQYLVWKRTAQANLYRIPIPH